MMASRWKVFTFFHSIPENEQKRCGPMRKVFCKTSVNGRNMLNNKHN
jgi:hypothetical protein